MSIETEKTTKQREKLPEHYSRLRDKKILITGAAGFIGGALFQQLNNYGLDVVGTVLYSEEAENLRTKGHKSEVLDLTSDEPWDEILKDVDIVRPKRRS